MLQKWYGIILLDKLNMCNKFMWYITENMDKETIDANIIELQGTKSKF